MIITEDISDYTQTRVQKNNTSGTPGVSWCKKSEKWKVRITHNKHTYNICMHSSFAVAKAIRLNAEKVLFVGIRYGIDRWLFKNLKKVSVNDNRTITLTVERS